MTFVRLDDVAWRSETLATFRAMAAEIEARFGPPTARDLDSNGVGLFDCYTLRFPCGLEVSIWRMHLDAKLRRVEVATEPAWFELYASEPDAEHALFHIGVHPHQATPPVTPTRPHGFVVMRFDDNGNRVEVCRCTSQCEADALAAGYEARGHKQTYWVEPPRQAPLS